MNFVPHITNFSVRLGLLPMLSRPLCAICQVTLFFAFTASFVFAQRGANGWVWQNPLPQGNPLSAIHFSKDRTFGLTVGADNSILTTENGGFEWRMNSVLGGANYNSVFVRDGKRAIVVGVRGAVLLTDNSGKDWKPVDSGTRDHLLDVTFAGPNNTVGWAVGTYGRVIKTTDGGETWNLQETGSLNDLATVTAFDAANAAAGGSGGMLVITNNGGAMWRSSSPCGTAAVNAIQFLTASEIVIGGGGGCVARTVDGGATWTRIEIGRAHV